MINGNIQFIAEVKTASPFGWRSAQMWDELFELANEHGDMLSIHTNPRWEGSMERISEARRRTEKPILAKGIHETDDEIEEALDRGANWVLVVGRIPERNAKQCLIEPYTLDELRRIPKELRAAWNSRDLKGGGLKPETFAEARRVFPGWLCQASNIRTKKDIQEGADAVLVGTYLKEFIESLKR